MSDETDILNLLMLCDDWDCAKAHYKMRTERDAALADLAAAREELGDWKQRCADMESNMVEGQLYADVCDDLARERARLDWLESNCNKGIGQHPVQGVRSSAVYSLVCLDLIGPGEWVPDLRIAIDSALRSASAKEGE